MPSSSQLLHEAGLRVTAPRLAVLETLREHPHADVAEVLRRTREGTTTISVQGVYDVLTILAENGLIRRIQPGSSSARFELERGDNHHHAVCRACQVLVDIPCGTGAAPCLDPRPVSGLGFQVDEAEVIYWGLCPRCQAGEDAGAGHGAADRAAYPATPTTPLHHTPK
ncbi:Fur family transcriptional regulator [Ornithinimicrobium cerasi]|uniref:Fur family transcriptional regulator, ferric uptake regulator n=1 Tax=Ornithinimicrobium cerasi TaxID=2248773 RepID=A0A285VLT8_9MICO|nr:Fur family transcriptional regulator [Ornithinimicrobium cerasi]SOC54837.1 Fur family transcriptional regulator, ferric uptake regulator [Ornithinimicrobium cerasi]